MAEAKKCSVGLVIVTQVPKFGDVAVLHIRGEVNPEKLPGGIEGRGQAGARCRCTAASRKANQP